MPIDPRQPYDDQNIFAKILRGELPCNKIYEDDAALAFHDIRPQAPVHVLVIPKKGIPRLIDSTLEDQALLGHLMLVAGKVAQAQGVAEAFRLVVNNGAGAGQTVFHLHLHVIGGMDFPEGRMAG